MKTIIFILAFINITTTLFANNSIEWSYNADKTNIQIQSIEDSLFSIAINCHGFYYMIDASKNIKLLQQSPDRIDVTIGNRFVYFNRVKDDKVIKYTPHYKEDTQLIIAELNTSQVIYFNNPIYQPISFNTKGFADLYLKFQATCK